MQRHAALAWALLALVALAPAPARAGDDGGAATTEEASLTGRQIYARVLRNRFSSFVQESRLASGDRLGREQETRLRMEWKDFRGDTESHEHGVLSKTLVKYSYPFDLRYSGYLVIENDGREHDQFVYFPSKRRIQRVNLRGESVFGTDFSFEDVIPRELQHATYARQPDEVLDDIPVFVVEAVPTALADSEYSRFRFYIEKQHYVPLLTRYWDEAHVEVKELQVDPASIEQFDGKWIPMAVTMRNLQLDSYTSLRVTSLIPNPDLPQKAFDLRRLESH